MLNIVLDKPCRVTIKEPSEAFQVSFGLSKQENAKREALQKVIDRCIGRKPSMERNKSGRSSKGGQRQKYLVCVNLIVVNFLKTVLNNSCGNAIV